MTRNRVGVLSGAFNPVTRAHLALVDAALTVVDEAICVVPRVYPHKELHGAAIHDRVEMLKRAGGRYHVHISELGLFIDIANELRRIRPEADFYFICGRDAAERVLTWDYGEPGAVERMFEQFQLLVAVRQGVCSPPEHLRHRVHSLTLSPALDEVSSTEVRRRIAAGEQWEHLIPGPIVELVRAIYSVAAS